MRSPEIVVMVKLARDPLDSVRNVVEAKKCMIDCLRDLLGETRWPSRIPVQNADM